MKSVSSLYNSLENHLRSAYYAQKDFRTKRHIVVFESDDWGSIRMSNKKDWDTLLRMGYSVDKRPYEKYDTLESPEDILALFDVLSKYSDSKGNHPVLTANMLMANPDFDKIKDSNYREYFFEPIEETYKRYWNGENILDLIRQGINEGVFMPQSHGREHFNVFDWLCALQNGDEDAVTAFQYRMCGIASKKHPERGNKMLIALRAHNEEHQAYIESAIQEGLQMFRKTFGFSSTSFVAPCYTWSIGIEKVLSENGVRLIQTARIGQPSFRNGKHYHYSGQTNSFGQFYSIRNCSFEPSMRASDNDSNMVINQIESCFKQNKIAVVSTHRINFVGGGMCKSNRTNTLSVLDKVLGCLVDKYPDIEFMSSDCISSLF